MNRTLLTNDELQNWLTERLRIFEGCEKCSSGGINELREPDEDGRNWSDCIHFRITGVPPEIYRPAIRQVLDEACSRFNVRWEPKKYRDDMKSPKIQMESRLLGVGIFHIDANCINAKQKLVSMNQIEQWADDGVILINMPNISYQEALAGNSDERTRKANAQIYTLTDIDQETPLFLRVRKALFPDGELTPNRMNDIRIVCDAVHFHAILITRDGNSKSQPGGILGNRDKLRDIVQIMSDGEAVAFIREKIVERDAFNRQVAAETGLPLPEWIGKD